MAGRGKRQRPQGKGNKPAASAASIPNAKAIAPKRQIDPGITKIGRGEVAGGAALILAAVAYTMSLSPTAALEPGPIVIIYLLAIIGSLALAAGGYHLDRRVDQPVRPDTRRWIYAGLATLFGLAYLFIIWFVMPNRMPSGMAHLLAIPVFTVMMAIGTFVGSRFGWWVAVIGGSMLLAATILLIIRILASAAFLAGVYGAFGKAAATFALVSVALIVEFVALLPICQVRFLMSRAGRRACGI